MNLKKMFTEIERLSSNLEQHKDARITKKNKSLLICKNYA